MDFKKRFALPLPALEEELGERLSLIPETDQEMEEQARRYQLSLAKPPGSLGELENIAVRLAGMTGQLKSRIRKKRILVLCADNGVVEEGVSSAPQSVTAMQACNMTRSLTGMSCLAREFHCECRVVDVGIATPYHCPEIVDRRIKKGTANLAKEAAMTRREALLAILTGMDLAEEAAKEGVDLLGVGEMGIGNTTTSSAVLAVLTGRSAREVTGRGRGGPVSPSGSCRPGRGALQGRGTGSGSDVRRLFGSGKEPDSCRDRRLYFDRGGTPCKETVRSCGRLFFCFPCFGRTRVLDRAKRIVAFLLFAATDEAWRRQRLCACFRGDPGCLYDHERDGNV